MIPTAANVIMIQVIYSLRLIIFMDIEILLRNMRNILPFGQYLAD